MSFNTLDWVMVAFVIMAAVGGWRLGLVTRALSWAGMALGVAVAARLIPPALESVERSGGRTEVLLIALILLVGGAFVGQSLGLIVGSRIGLGRRSPVAHRLDAVGGAVAGVLGVLVAVWLVVPALADVPGWQSRQARTSELARAVDRFFPDPPDATQTVRRLLGGEYPSVVDALRPTPEVGPPPPGSGLDRATSDRVVRSTVKLVGEACNRIQQGSGFVAGPDLVVTNAHVVAGVESSLVERSDGSRVPGTVVAFDARRDLAVLSAPGLDRPPLPLGDAEPSGAGAVFGHPGGGPLELSPFNVGPRVDAVGSDIYGEAGTRRDVLTLAASLAPGDSGAALVDPQGRVVGVAFAVAPDREGVAYALSIAELRPVLAAAGSDPISTGPCIA